MQNTDKHIKRIIGMWGYPDPQILDEIKSRYPDNKIIDLDIDYKYPETGIVPDAYCRIIRNIINNAVYLKDRLDVIVASVGEEKCDSGRTAAIILKDTGFNIVETRFEKYGNFDVCFPVSKSSLPLSEKINLIMSGIAEAKNHDLKESKPDFGFWGVPPNDMSFLDIFPDTTHVYGWTRCVEAKRPADIELEMYVDENIPTVFFAQTFCSKMQLAKYLAKKYNGLYIDVDDYATRSVKAKIEAFIKLR
jgi:hypothetical protein